MQVNSINQIGLSDNSEMKLFGVPEKYDYSKYSKLEEFDWDEELMAKFSPIAQKLNLSQESVEMLLELALEMSRKQKNIYEQDDEIKHENLVAEYNKMLCDDCEIPDKNSVRLKEYMMVANSAYSEFCTPALKEVFSKAGLIFHPELVKFFHKLGELSMEDNLSHFGQPSVEELTPAQILYGTKN